MDRVMHHLGFVTGFFLLASYFQGSHIVACNGIAFLFWLNNAPLYVHATCCSPFISWTDIGFFLLWGHYEYAAIYIQVFVWNLCSALLETYLRVEW